MRLLRNKLFDFALMRNLFKLIFIFKHMLCALLLCGAILATYHLIYHVVYSDLKFLKIAIHHML